MAGDGRLFRGLFLDLHPQKSMGFYENAFSDSGCYLANALVLGRRGRGRGRREQSPHNVRKVWDWVSSRGKLKWSGPYLGGALLQGWPEAFGL